MFEHGKGQEFESPRAYHLFYGLASLASPREVLEPCNRGWKTAIWIALCDNLEPSPSKATRAKANAIFA
jgi:hypothetical protein